MYGFSHKLKCLINIQQNYFFTVNLIVYPTIVINGVVAISTFGSGQQTDDIGYYHLSFTVISCFDFDVSAFRPVAMTCDVDTIQIAPLCYSRQDFSVIIMLTDSTVILTQSLQPSVHVCYTALQMTQPNYNDIIYGAILWTSRYCEWKSRRLVIVE